MVDQRWPRRVWALMSIAAGMVIAGASFAPMFVSTSARLKPSFCTAWTVCPGEPADRFPGFDPVALRGWVTVVAALFAVAIPFLASARWSRYVSIAAAAAVCATFVLVWNSGRAYYTDGYGSGFSLLPGWGGWLLIAGAVAAAYSAVRLTRPHH